MKASVAYESRKIPDLRWKRDGKRGYVAKGRRGVYTIRRHDGRVDRAKGIFRWTLSGAVPTKSHDDLSQLKACANVFDKAMDVPAVSANEGRGEHDTMIPPPVPTMPASGTRGPPVGMHYATTVQEKLERMGSPTPLEDVQKSSAYLADCERGGVSPEVAAAVILGTLHHGHAHTGPKVTDFALEEARRRRSPSPPNDYEAARKVYRQTVALSVADLVRVSGQDLYAKGFRAPGDRERIATMYAPDGSPAANFFRYPGWGYGEDDGVSMTYWLLPETAADLEIARESRITAARRHSLPSSEFAIPELEALPLDTVKRIRNAPARLEMMHNAGSISEAQYRRAEHRIAAASKAHGIHSQYAREAYEAPTREEWEVVVDHPPAAHRGHILSLTDPGDGFEAGNKIILWGFYDDREASHVATAIARRYKVPVTFGPKRAVEREDGAHGRPFGEAREGRKTSDENIALTAIIYSENESGLAAVPDVVRLLSSPVEDGGQGWSPEAAKAVLMHAAQLGYIELRPESGMGRLSKADAKLCPTGPGGVPLSWVRDLGTAPSAPEAREAHRRQANPEACGCKPFTVVSKDPELYAKCKKRADTIGPLTSPRAIYDYVSSDMALATHEEFRVLGIGSRGELEGKLITDARVAHGDQHEVKVYIEQISQILLADRPDIYVLVHSHPGGDATPSPEDETLTTSLVDGLKAPCPHIVYGDHIVVARKEFYSFREGKKTKIR